MQDKKHGGSEQGEESTAGGVSAVRKGIVLAFLLMTCAVALPNTVTNDVVVATSDAELRISDRGLGLGLEVVGGGAAEVKLEARPGWRFRDGSTSVTLMKAAGEAETDSSTHTFTVNLTKGESKRLNFSVVGKTCSICDGEVASDAATDSVEIDVYEIRFITPSGDPAGEPNTMGLGQNEFTYIDKSQACGAKYFPRQLPS